MKKRGLLFSIVSTMCVGLVAGCGETKHYITMTPISNEFGSVEGTGNYVENSTVRLKAYVNKGCAIGDSPDKNVMVKFRKNGESTPEDTDIRLNQSADGSYYFYEFVAKPENAGEFIVMYHCYENDASDLEAENTVKYDITYTLINNITDQTPIYKPGTEEPYEIVAAKYENDGTTLISEKNTAKLAGGSLIEEVTYIREYDSDQNKDHKIKWYVKNGVNVGQLVEYDFSKLVSGNIDLYGVPVVQTPYQMISEALSHFKSNNYFEVASNNNQTATVLDLPKGTSNSKFHMYVEVNAGNLMYVVKDGWMYISRGQQSSDSAKFKLGDANTFALEEIDELYRFIEINKVNVADLKESETDEDYKYSIEDLLSETIGGKVYRKFKLVEKDNADNDIIVYISDGKLYKTVIGSVENTIRFLDGTQSAKKAQTDDNMYFINLVLKEEDKSVYADLNAQLEELNSSFSSILKIVPNYQETLGDLFQTDEIRKLLKYYAYNVSLTQPTTHGSRTIDVVTSISALKEAAEALKLGGFDVVSTVKVDGFGVTSREYPVASGVNIFELKLEEVGMDPAKLHEKIYRAFDDMYKAIYEDNINIGREYYHKFQYSYDAVTQEGTYSFYKTKDDSVPYLKVTLKDNMVVKFSYYDNENTYVSEIEYNEVTPEPTPEENVAEILTAIDELWEGGYTINVDCELEAQVEDDYYYNLTEKGELSDTAWNFIQSLKEFKNNYSSYEYDGDANTYTKADEGAYKFTLDGSNLSSVEFTPDGGTSVIYLIGEVIGS